MVTILNQVKNDEVTAICRRFDLAPENLLEILHAVQSSIGALSDGILRQIANELNVSEADIFGVVTFYHDFDRKHDSSLEVQICRGEACQAVGAEDLIRIATAQLGCELDEPCGQVALKSVFCLGNCALGPSVRIGDAISGRVSWQHLAHLVDEALEQTSGD